MTVKQRKMMIALGVATIFQVDVDLLSAMQDRSLKVFVVADNSQDAEKRAKSIVRHKMKKDDLNNTMKYLNVEQFGWSVVVKIKKVEKISGKT
jgi:hypothetical protein